METGSINLFCYGALLLDDVQKEVFGRVLTGADDALPDYATDASLEAGEGDEVAECAHPAPGQEVPGKLYHVTATELQAADKYEGASYGRVLLPLKSGEKAWVYVTN